MTKTLNDYSNSVQKIVDTTSSSDVSVINEEIKNIYQDVLHQVQKYITATTTENITAVIGQNNYSTTTDFMEVFKVYWKGVNDNDYRQLKVITEQDYLDNYINLDNSTPNKYWVKANKIYVNPAPSEEGVFRVAYTPIVSDLEDVTDVSIIPDRFAKVIIYGASSKYLAYEKDPSADIYERYYLNALADMVNELKTQAEPTKPIFRERRRFRTNINFDTY